MRNLFRSISCFIIIAIFTTACTVKVPLTPNVGQIDISERLPVEAGLLITEENKNYVFKGNPESFTGSARPHEFRLGEALETASIQTFSQIFDKIHLIRTLDEAKKYSIYIEPVIREFHFRYDQLSYAGFSVAVLSKIKIHVTLASGAIQIWEKTVESPEIKKGPWFINVNYEKEVGEAASEALVITLKEIAMDIVEYISTR